MAGFPLTGEQENCRSKLIQGGWVKIQAGAGTGKTSTLHVCGEAVPDEKFQYIAFNSSIAYEAKRKFPRNVTCATMHSHAFHAVGKQFVNAGRQLPPKAKRVWSNQVADILHINSVNFGDRSMGRNRVAAMTLATVTRFCYSRDEQISPKHVPLFNGMELWGESQLKEVRAIVAAYALRAWKDICDLNGVLRFEHDYYLKMYAMQHPCIPCDVMMLDEGQDSNPVTLQIFQDQGDLYDTQLVIVGDSCQSIYGWRGASNAMETFEADDTCYLSKSFRFGPAIAEEANKFLGLLDAQLRLVGYEEIDSVVRDIEHPRAILCRTNAQVIAEALAAQKAGRSVYVEGGTYEIIRFAEAAEKLQQGVQVEHPELIGFKNWKEVTEYVEQDDSAKDLKTFVKIINDYGVQGVIAVAKQCVEKESGSDLTVSTAHKAKGREWQSVTIASDFREPEIEWTNEEQWRAIRPDLMLAYVSVTRAQQTLNVGGLDWVDRWVQDRRVRVGASASSD